VKNSMIYYSRCSGAPMGVFYWELKVRTIEWDEKKKVVKLIDQSILPMKFHFVELATHEDVFMAIKKMVVRGAPAIGVAGVYGMALAAFEYIGTDLAGLKKWLNEAGPYLNEARPTAVNLSWGIQKSLDLTAKFEGSTEELQQALLELAHRLADEDVATNMRIAKYGAELIADGDAIVHHCNTGALATVDYGTALGVIRMAHEQGKRVHVYVDETRPRLQGSRLTAWELEQYGISYDIITDSSSGYLMRAGKVDKVLFGADRVAMNGDVVNKIGTYMLALAAYDNLIPAYSVFPISTVDFNCPSGDLIPIEERDPAEVLNLQFNFESISPEGATARNFAFDVTPQRLISGLITEHGVLYPPFFHSLAVLRAKGA
jgi:methylthioribose-1-phosphate isomerase